MESCGRSLVHIGTYKRFPSRTFQPNEHVMRDMFLNLMAIVGFIFFGLILLHLFFEIDSKYSLYAYIAIFIGLECSVMSVRFYLYLKEKIRRQESYNDVEDFISEVVRISAQKRESDANPLLSSYDSKLLPHKKIDNQKRNSF